jgi:AsnC-like helix-turn-helix protein
MDKKGACWAARKPASLTLGGVADEGLRAGKRHTGDPRCAGGAAADAITGEYNIVVTCISPDINALGTLIVEGIQRLDGVHKTTTCLALT